MVDACNEFLAALQLVFHAKGFQQAFAAHLHAVAQAHSLYAGIALHKAGEHGHGVGVIEEPGVRAHLFHVPGKVCHDRDGAQGPHDAANAQGVADSLAQAVLFGHLKVDDGAGVVQANLDGVYHKVRPAQGFLAVFYPQKGGDFAKAAQGLVHGP